MPTQEIIPSEHTETSLELAETSVALTIIEQQERANIDMLISTAKRYPRDIIKVKRAMEAMACLDQETAESCNYHLERDGHSIDGPSVRMAEIAVACYQNIRAGSRVVGNDGKVIIGQAFCHDMENNVFIAWETPRRITNKKGQTFSEDMQVTTGNAAAAIAFRNAVLKVIPAALVKPIAEKARRVAFGDIKTLSNRRTRAFNSLAKLGVDEARVLNYLKKPSVADVDVADVEKLYGVFTAIKEQSTTIEETFGEKQLPVKPAQFDNKPTASEDLSGLGDASMNVDDKQLAGLESTKVSDKKPGTYTVVIEKLIGKDKVTESEVIAALNEKGIQTGDAGESGLVADLPDPTKAEVVKLWSALLVTIQKLKAKAAKE